MSILSPQLAPVFATAMLAALIIQAGGCARAIEGPTLEMLAARAHDEGAAADFQAENIHKVIFRSKLDMILDHYLIYERPGDGVLELHEGLSRYPIAESWRLWKFEKAGWVKRDNWDEIYVIASYATGMGPDGAKPFRAKIIMERTNIGWVPSSTEILAEPEEGASQILDENSADNAPPPKPPAPPEKFKPQSKYDRAHVETATNQQEFDALVEKKSAKLADILVDFPSERLVTATRMLTSGSIKMRDVRVHKNKTGYDISYSLYRPRIGTADIKFSAIYAVLPNDGLPLNVFERTRGARPKGERIDVVVGVLNRVS